MTVAPLRREAMIAVALATVSGISWAALLTGPAVISAPALCTGRLIADLPSGAELRYLLAQASPAALATSWTLMVAAMMVPLFASPLCHVLVRSLSRARLRMIGSFVGGYLAVWLAAGVPLIGLAITVRAAFAEPRIAVGVVFAVAVAWQACGWKRVALNRCHARPVLGGEMAALSFGTRHGLWCLAGCAPLMIAALLAPAYTGLAMIAAALWIWAERLEPPRGPGFGLIWPRRASRAAAHHLRLALAPPRRAASGRGRHGASASLPT